MMVSWIRHWNLNHVVRGSSNAAALLSFGNMLIYICHSPPRWSKWVPGRQKFFERLKVYTSFGNGPSPLSKIEMEALITNHMKEYVLTWCFCTLKLLLSLLLSSLSMIVDYLSFNSSSFLLQFWWTDCLRNPCKNGWCEETMVGFKCHCSEGYTGNSCGRYNSQHWNDKHTT